MFQKFLYQLSELENRNKAISIASKLNSKFKNTEFAMQANLLLGNLDKISKEYDNTSLENVIKGYKLFGNYPNPFNPSTKIKYSILCISNVKLEIYDVMGRLIRTFEINSQVRGNHEIEWNSTNMNGEKVANGIYFCRVTVEGLEDNGEISEKQFNWIEIQLNNKRSSHFPGKKYGKLFE